MKKKKKKNTGLHFQLPFYTKKSHNCHDYVPIVSGKSTTVSLIYFRGNGQISIILFSVKNVLAIVPHITEKLTSAIFSLQTGFESF